MEEAYLRGGLNTGFIYCRDLIGSVIMVYELLN